MLFLWLSTSACGGDGVVVGDVATAAEPQTSAGNQPTPGPAPHARRGSPSSREVPLPVVTEIDGLVPGRWIAMGHNTIRDVLPDPVPAGRSLRGIVAAWNGGAWDSRRGRLLVMGGGHGDYSGNEIYAFDVRVRRWQRLTEPTPEPVSVHNYDQVEYLPDFDLLFLAGGSTFPTGRPTNATWLYDFQQPRWIRAPDIPGRQREIFDFNMLTVYDALNERLIMIGFAAAADFDPAQRRWRRHGKLPKRQLGHNAELDPERRVIVSIGQGTAFVYRLDSSGRVLDRAPLDSTGANEIEAADAPGLAYDARRRRLTAWASGSNFYTLDLDSRRWSRHELAGPDPGDPYARRIRGTFGRFRYMPQFDAFIVATGIDEPVHVFRPRD